MEKAQRNFIIVLFAVIALTGLIAVFSPHGEGTNNTRTKRIIERYHLVDVVAYGGPLRTASFIDDGVYPLSKELQEELKEQSSYLFDAKGYAVAGYVSTGEWKNKYIIVFYNGYGAHLILEIDSSTSEAGYEYSQYKYTSLLYSNNNN